MMSAAISVNLRLPALALLLPTLALSPAMARDAPASASDLPVSRITLYRSGVAAIERQTRIDGPQAFQLRFRQEEIDDLLRSMVLLDPNGGAGTVAYASRDPLERRLGSLRIDLSGNPSIPEILSQLRGAKVRLDLTGTTLTGTVLGTETRTIPTSGDRAQLMPQPYVSLLTDEGIRSVSIAEIRSFRIMDAELAGDLDRALAAAYEDRAEQVRTVEVSFRGDPGRPRDVFVAYVQEAPVWKTSYRLVLGEPGTEQPNLLQAWAIVENATDEDWRGVELSLASGRPVAFTMRLADPIYAFRPELPVPAAEGIRPRDFAAGRATSELRQVPAPRADARSRAPGGGGSLFGGGPEEESMSIARRVAAPAMADAMAAAGGDASGQDVGGQFLFTVDLPVSLDRRRSAMIPLATKSVPAQRFSIFDGRRADLHPMRGAEITNESGLDLLPGPIAVFDSNRYAGDATIQHLARGQKRLIAFAQDTDTEVRSQVRTGRNILRIGASDGQLRTRLREHWTRTYSLSTTDTREGRTVLIEHPRTPNAELVGITPRETTDDAYRFEVSLAPGGSEQLVVREERVAVQSQRIGSMTPEAMIQIIGTGQMDPKLAEALRTASRMQRLISEAQAALAESERRVTEITQEQQRLRSNIAAVPQGSDLHARYLRTLNQQEDELEDLARHMTEQRTAVNQRRQEFNRFLNDLSIE